MAFLAGRHVDDGRLVPGACVLREHVPACDLGVADMRAEVDDVQLICHSAKVPFLQNRMLKALGEGVP